MADKKIDVEIGIQMPRYMSTEEMLVEKILKRFMKEQENVRVAYCARLMGDRLVILQTRDRPGERDREPNDSEQEAIHNAMREGGITLAILWRDVADNFQPMDFRYEETD